MSFTGSSHAAHLQFTGTSHEEAAEPQKAKVLHFTGSSQEVHHAPANNNNLYLFPISKYEEEHEKDYLKDYLSGKKETLEEYVSHFTTASHEGNEVHMKSVNKDELLDIDQAATLLGRTNRQVYTYIEKGKLRKIKAKMRGKSTFVIRAEVEALKAELAEFEPDVKPAHEVHENFTSTSQETSQTSYEVHEEDVQPVPVEQPKEETRYLVDVWAEVDRRIAQAVQPYMEKVEKLEAQNKVLLDRLNAIEEHNNDVDAFISEWREKQKEKRPFWARLFGG